MQVIEVDYQNTCHQQHLMQLLQAYALDPMGGGTPLTEYCQQHLIEQLQSMSSAYSFLLYQQQQPIGFANSFLGFSTFACAPLLNIHDFYVQAEFRSHGLAQKLLAAIADRAEQLGCVKLTLEVLQENKAAQAAYRRFGFQPYQLDEKMGQASFWQKNLEVADVRG